MLRPLLCAVPVATSGAQRSTRPCHLSVWMGVCCGKDSTAPVPEEGVKVTPPGGRAGADAPALNALPDPSTSPRTPPGPSEGDTATVASVLSTFDNTGKVGAEWRLERGDGSDELGRGTWSSSHVRVWRRRGGVSGETLLRDLTSTMWWWRSPPYNASDEHDSEGASSDEWVLLRQVLCTHPLFAICRHDAWILHEIMDAFERHETQPGEVIVSPGDTCAFHVVVMGKALADVDDYGAMTVQEKGQRQEWTAGDYFGSEGLLYILHPGYEGAAVRAEGTPDASLPTVTWRLSRVLYQQFMRTFHDPAHLQIIKYLSQSPLLQHLSRAQIRHLCEKAEVVTREISARVLQVGVVPTDLFLLISGTVTLEHEPRHGGGNPDVAHLPTAVFVAGDCVGDAELLFHRVAAEKESTDASKRLTVMPSCYTYTVQQPAQLICIPIEVLLAVLSWDDLQHMRDRSRNVREMELHQVQVQDDLRNLKAQCFLSNLSDTDSNSSMHAPVLQGGPGGAASPLSGELSHDSSQDVYAKGPDATAFFLEQIFPRQTYRRADGRERGLSIASFAPHQRYPAGTVLFRVEYAADHHSVVRAGGGVSPHREENGEGSTADSSTAATPPEVPGRLYAIVSGEITVVNSDTGEPVYRVFRGNTLGEETLLPPLRCRSATTPLRTHAVVSSSDGCEVFELSRRAFKEFLQRPYCDALRDFCDWFSVSPFKGCLPETCWRFLFNCTTEREVVGSDLIGLRGASCKYVSLIFDGQIGAYVRSSVSDSGEKQENEEETSVASFLAGDIIGGWEVMEGRPFPVAYVCECRARILCVPAESFPSLFRPAMLYLQFLWSQERYQRVMAVSSVEG
ncbi:hypothetical protein, unknown function [Leishmania braziliensis MHOM/BR/75/M2904]|uniref:Cyclic nucleotide-binding domain-containing protein n=1 Tax=Leishmania braziliensis TaxID=5660 RepID=A4HJ27_LEIBR|nr:hypothetical protein, unknown function [Leishmania braziliensis MHOM/BR/75/M2904]CAJ2477708.1 unnamed protein product [Leishmania braziliensis]CAM42485.2 hypothetical protein, unknown function [Leishmania braziliensis MHOM/BR/75/M2904]